MTFVCMAIRPTHGRQAELQFYYLYAFALKRFFILFLALPPHGSREVPGDGPGCRSPSTVMGFGWDPARIPMLIIFSIFILAPRVAKMKFGGCRPPHPPPYSGTPTSRTMHLGGCHTLAHAVVLGVNCPEHCRPKFLRYVRTLMKTSLKFIQRCSVSIRVGLYTDVSWGPCRFASGGIWVYISVRVD